MRLLVTLFTVYSDKVGWYKPFETFPPYVKNTIGPVLNGKKFTALVKSQGNKVGLFQRFLRVTQIFTHEYTTWTSFKKKATTLIWKYLLRYEAFQRLNTLIEKSFS